MPSHERENARKEKKRQSDSRTRKIIWSVLILVIVVLIIMKVCEIDFAAVKNRFTDADGKFTLSMTTQEDAYPYALDSSKNVKVNAENDKLNILTDVSCTVLNPTDAKVVYSFSHGYANPVIRYAGNYFCLIDQGATRLRLDKLNENVYETKSENAILTADVAKNGNVIYAARSDESKSTVVVLNASLKRLAELEVNAGYVVGVAIDASGKKCAYAVVNSKDASLVTTVYTFNVGDEKEKAHFDYVGTNLVDLHYASSNLYFVGTDCVYTISSQKKQKEVFKQGSVNTVCYNYTKDDELVYVYSKYSDANENFLVRVNDSGKVKTEIELKQKPKYLSSASNEICVLFSDKVVTYSLTKGEEKNTYPCDDSIGTVNKMSSKVFVSRHQLIDVLD